MLSRWVLVLGMAAVAAGSQSAAAIDVHAFWDSRCVECHSHAGAFSRAHLSVENGRLAGKHHRGDLERFLGQHESSGEHAGALYQMLLAQAQTQPLFQPKCGGCHGTAAEFARTSLVLEGGVALTKDGRRPVLDVLAKHGRVSADEARTISDSLARVLGEVGAAKPK